MRAADLRCREKGGMISLFLNGHGNTLLRTLREIYGKGFAARYPETAKLSEVTLQLNETSLSQLRRDYETDHLEQDCSGTEMKSPACRAGAKVNRRWRDYTTTPTNEQFRMRRRVDLRWFPPRVGRIRNP